MEKLKRFMPFIKKPISVNWADKMKKKDNFLFIQVDEIIIFLIGVIVFFYCSAFLFFFAISVLMWYWLKIRYYERLIVRKKKDIYNIQYDNAEGVDMRFAEKKTIADREPLYYDLEMLEIRRKFLVDIFVVINLVLLILLGLKS